MRTLIAIVAALLLSGCAAGHWNVVGRSGKIYQAPDLCQALVVCLDAKESSCYYATWKYSSGQQIGADYLYPNCQETENK